MMSSSPAIRLLLSCIAFYGIGADAQANAHNGFHLRNWTTREGIPQNSVLDIALANDGGLWISTEAGVALTHGRQIKVFDLDDVPGLTNNRIPRIEAGLGEDLWLGVSGGQILRGNEWGWEVIPTEWDGRRNRIQDLVVDPDGRVWVASDIGVGVYQGESFALLPDLEGPVRDLQVLARGGVIAAGKQGLHRMELDTTGAVVLKRLVERPAAVVTELADGRILFRSGEQLLDLKGNVIARDMSLAHKVLVADPRGGFWTGTQEGLVHFDGQAWTRPRTQEPGALGPSTVVRSLLIHPDGHLWVGTNRKGLFQLYPSPLEGYAIQRNHEEGVHMVGIDPAGEVWGFGTSTTRLVDGELAIHHRRGYTAVAPSQEGSFFWAYGDDGLGMFESGRFKPHPLSGEVPPGLCRALLEDSKGRLWIGLPGRLLRIEGGEVVELTPPAGTRFGHIRALAEDASGAIWISGGPWILRMHEEADTQFWARGEELPRGPVRTLRPMGNGDVWLGTYGGGLVLYREGTFTHFTTASGLPENVVTAIHEDGQGSLILLGNQGITRVSLAELNGHVADPDHRVALQMFESCPGLVTVEGNSVSASPAPVSADGTIWLPTLEGLVSFHPDRLIRPERAPEVHLLFVLEDGTRGEVARDGGHALQLPPDSRLVELEFFAPDFSPFSTVLYRYQMEGLIPGWTHREGAGRSWFHRLRKGDYHYRIQAAHVDHDWGPLHPGLEVHVPPFFYETAWFRTLAGIGIVGLIALLIRWRTLRIRRHSKHLASVVSDRTRDLRLQIREREAAEAQLQAAHDALELAVADRTRELASTLEALERDVAHRESLEVRLKESEKMEIVGRLAGGIAHDFNNILTAVLGESELARMEGEATRNQDLVASMDNIASNVERASRLTRQLLAYSRQQVLQPIVLDPRRHLSGIEEMLRRLTPGTVKLSIDLSGSGDNVRMDPGQLEQVLVNLVVNAGESMQRAGEVRVWIEETTKGEEEAESLGIVPGKYVVLNVMDEGGGMHPETASRMFEPFFSTKNRSRGLGLASVHGIVHQSGGTIEVSTELGQGTTFRVLLPAVDEPVKQYVLPTPARRPDGEDSIRVLLCDDEEAVLGVLQASLELRGFAVSAVNSPEAALELAQTMDPRPDLLISDMAMPGMDGFTLARRVRAAIGPLPTIFITGYSLDVLAEGDSLPEGSVLLQKPFTQEELITRVGEALTAAPGRPISDKSV